MQEKVLAQVQTQSSYKIAALNAATAAAVFLAAAMTVDISDGSTINAKDLGRDEGDALSCNHHTLHCHYPLLVTLSSLIEATSLCCVCSRDSQLSENCKPWRSTRKVVLHVKYS